MIRQVLGLFNAKLLFTTLIKEIKNDFIKCIL